MLRSVEQNCASNSERPEGASRRNCSWRPNQLECGSDRGHMNFTPKIDRLIVAGFWGDMKAMLLLLAEEGFSRTAVFHRAGKMGLMKGRSSHRARIISAALLVRQCLRCDQVFVAEGHFNRLCRQCRTRG